MAKELNYNHNNNNNNIKARSGKLMLDAAHCTAS